MKGFRMSNATNAKRAMSRRALNSPLIRTAGKTTAAICAALLASCSGQTDSGAIQVVHALQSPFAEAEVLDTSGKSLAKTSFACTPGQSCLLVLPKDLLVKTTALRFRDSTGRLVGAYPQANLPAIGYTVTADADMMGLELFNRLVAQGRYTPATLAHLADRHIYSENPAGARPTFFSDLQSHYQRALADPAYNEQKYVEAILKAIDVYSNGKAASANLGPGASTTRARALATGSTVTLGCTTQSLNGVASLILPMLGTPLGLPFFSVAGTVSGIIGNICNFNTWMGAANLILKEIDDIQASLDAMDVKLTSLGVRVDEIAKQVAFNNVLANYDAFNNDLLAVNNYISTYKALLRPVAASTGYVAPANGSLNEYIQSLPGGLNKDTWATYPALKVLIADWKVAIDNYNKLVGSTRALGISSSLNSLCATPTNITGDVLERRTQCNLLVQRLIVQSAASMQQLVRVMGDVLTAIDAQYVAAANNPDQLNWLRANLINNYPSSTASPTWAQTKQQIPVDLLNNLEAMTGKLYPVLIATTDGLPKDLISNLIAAGCDKSSSGQTVAAIESWIIKEASTGVASPAGPYITTQCKGRNDELVYSRFHYATDVGPQNTVLNLLGVLIKPTPQVSDWGPRVSETLSQGYSMWGPSSSGYAKRNICIDGGGGRCEWWAVVPGVATPAAGASWTQVRAHTGPATSTTQRVTVNDAYFYNPPNNDRIFFPVTTAMGFTQGYSTGPIQYLNGTAYTYDRGVIDAYLSYTWVTDTASWQTKSDRRFTRTVILGAGIDHTKDDNYFNTWNTSLLNRCVTADCKVEDNLKLILSYTGGPKIQWDYFNGEWGKMHMFVDGKGPDGRAIPNNWGLRQ